MHFATNSRHLMGGTALKRRLLQVWLNCDLPVQLCAQLPWVCFAGRTLPASLPPPPHLLPTAPSLAACRSAWAGRQWRFPSTTGGAWHPPSAALTCGAS